MLMAIRIIAKGQVRTSFYAAAVIITPFSSQQFMNKLCSATYNWFMKYETIPHCIFLYNIRAAAKFQIRYFFVSASQGRGGGIQVLSLTTQLSAFTIDLQFCAGTSFKRPICNFGHPVIFRAHFVQSLTNRPGITYSSKVQHLRCVKYIFPFIITEQCSATHIPQK